MTFRECDVQSSIHQLTAMSEDAKENDIQEAYINRHQNQPITVGGLAATVENPNIYQTEILLTETETIQSRMSNIEDINKMKEHVVSVRNQLRGRNNNDGLPVAR